MTDDLEEKRRQLDKTQQSLNNLKLTYNDATKEHSENPTIENQEKLLEIKNAIREVEIAVGLQTAELSFDEKKDSFNFEKISDIEDADQTTPLKPNIPAPEGDGYARALGKGKELKRKTSPVPDDMKVGSSENPPIEESEYINYISKNVHSNKTADTSKESELKINQDQSIEPEI